MVFWFLQERRVGMIFAIDLIWNFNWNCGNILEEDSRMKKKILSNEEDRFLKFLLFGALGLIMCFVFVSCENYQIKSQWRDRVIVVDGRSADWLDALTYVEEFNISVGMANDTDFLYVCAVVGNPLVRMRVMRQGLTVWFDPKDGRKKSLGIRFPLGSQGRRERPAEFGEESDMEILQRVFLLSLNELEILGPDRTDVRRINKTEAKGVDVAMSVSSGLLVYELKVPLINSPEQAFAINVQPGRSFGIGIETSPQSRDKEQLSRPSRTGGMGRPGSGGNPGMGRTGGMSQMPGGGGPAIPKNLKLWLSVSLGQEKSPF